MNDDKEFLGKEPIGKLLLRLALPTVAAQLINMLYNIVDRIYIGHIPDIGATALTGVGVCMPLILIVSAFAALVGYGVAPRASIFMGKKDNESAEKILGNCFTLQILISVVLTVILLIWNYVRVLSRNHSKRALENQRYLELREKVLGRFRGSRSAARDKNFRIFRCPSCHQKVRVPRGKGRISITCPKCRHEFIKKT